MTVSVNWHQVKIRESQQRCIYTDSYCIRTWGIINSVGIARISGGGTAKSIIAVWCVCWTCRASCPWVIRLLATNVPSACHNERIGMKAIAVLLVHEYRGHSNSSYHWVVWPARHNSIFTHTYHSCSYILLYICIYIHRNVGDPIETMRLSHCIYVNFISLWSGWCKYHEH